MENKMKRVKVFKILQCDFVNWLTNYKMYLVLILLAYFLSNNFDSVFEFARSARCRVTPWLLPFCFTHPFMRIVIFVCVVFLFSNAPFMTSFHTLFLSRTGKKQWYIAQIIYLFICSILVTIFLAFYPVLCNASMIVTKGGWGKVLKTLAYNTDVVHPIVASVINCYSAKDVMIYTLILCVLLFFFLGMVIFLCNVLFERQVIGVLVACFFVILDWFAYLSGTKVLTWVSPISWVEIASMAYGRDVTVPTIEYAIVCLVVVNVILMIGAYVASQKRDINVIQN